MELECLALAALDAVCLLVHSWRLAKLITVRQLRLDHLLGPIIDHVVLLVGVFEELFDFLVSVVDGHALALVEDHARDVGGTTKLRRIQVWLLPLHDGVRIR